MDPKARRTRVLKIVGGISLGLFAGVLGLVAWFRHVEERSWRAMEDRVCALVAESRGRTFTRSVLRGTAIPGDAWEEYGMALEEGILIKTELSLEVGYDRSFVEDLLQSHGRAIGHLRQGVQRSEAHPPGCPDSGAKILLYGRSLGPLSQLVILQSRLLDLALFGCDMSQNSSQLLEGYATEVRSGALNELHHLIVVGRLSEECLGLLDRELAVLDSAAPDRALIVSNNTAMLGRWYIAKDQADALEGLEFPTRSWRYGFSKRLKASAFFRQVDDWNRRAGEATQMPWPEAVKVHESIWQENDERDPVTN